MKYIFGFILVFLVSCISSSYKPVIQYDLKPSETSSKIAFSVAEVSLDGPYNKKMVLRRGDVLQEQEYSRWSASPDVLIQRYWKLRLQSAAGVVYSRAVVRIFEIDLSSRKAVIVLDLEGEQGTKRLSAQESVGGENTAAYVAAMKKALVQITAQIAALQ
jgi:hypothetical protein